MTLLPIVFFSSFLYSVKFGFSPVYIVVPFFMFLFLILSKVKLVSPYFLFTSLALLCICHYKSYTHGAFVNSVIGVSVLGFFDRLNLKLKIRDIAFAYKGVVLLFVIEAAFRIFFPSDTTIDSNQWYMRDRLYSFYQYKFDSFMFVDSNLTGIALLMILGIGCSLTAAGVLSRFWPSTVFVLLMLTFSRAAYLGLGIFVWLSFPRAKWSFLLNVAFLLALSVVLMGYLTNDPSGATKVQLYADFFEQMQRADFSTLLLGNGFGWFQEQFGVASHSILIQTVLEGGGLYTILFLICLFKAKAFSSRRNIISFAAVSSASMFASLYVISAAWLVSSLILFGINENES